MFTKLLIFVAKVTAEMYNMFKSKLPLLKRCAKEQKKEVERYEKEIFRSNGTRIILCNGTDRLFRRQQTGRDNRRRS